MNNYRHINRKSVKDQIFRNLKVKRPYEFLARSIVKIGLDNVPSPPPPPLRRNFTFTVVKVTEAKIVILLSFINPLIDEYICWYDCNVYKFTM